MQFIGLKDLFYANKGPFFEFSGEGFFLPFDEFYDPIRKSEQCVVFSAHYIPSGMKFSSSLSNDDLSGLHFLSTEYFYSQSLGNGIPTQLGGSSGFSMGHIGWFLNRF
jgi:hypothetical protein